MIELTFTSGYQVGRTVRANDERFSIGRSPGNALTIRNPHVSSRHGLIVKKGEEYLYQDLDSTNGTLVRRKGGTIYLGRNTRLELPLQDGDELVLGVLPNLIVMKVHVQKGEDPVENGSRSIIATRSMKDLPLIDTTLKQDHKALLALYDYTKEIQCLKQSTQVLEVLSRSVFDLLSQASHLAIVRWDPKRGEYLPVLSRVRQGGSEPRDFRLSRSIIQHVTDKKEALLFQDAPSDFRGAESVLSGKILSSICVPLWDQEGIQGILQVDNRESEVMFEPRDLEILTIIGNHTATLLSNIELFESLKETLHRLELMELAKCHMSKFVPTSVKKIIEEDPRGLKPEKMERFVTVMFLDICGYTKMNETMGYEKVNHIVEHYFSLYLDEIYAHNGDINETAGDGLMVIYQGEEQHARDAVGTAVCIQQRTSEVNAEKAGEQTPVFVNIGINTGRALVGLVCFEGASGARWTYTASGSATNLSARMAAHAEKGQIIIGQATADLLNGEAPLEDLGTVLLKNVSQPVQLYRVLF